MPTFRNILTSLRNSKVLENYSYMTALQIASALIGLVIYPIVIRRLGAEAMGMYAFLVSIVVLFQVIEEYGFDMPATKEVSLATRQEQLDKIIRLTYLGKFIMFVVAILVAIPVVLFIPTLRVNSALFAVIFVQLLYSILFPQWYYQGRKNMRTATIIQFVLRVCQIPLVLVFVHETKDLIIYAAIVSGTLLCGGLVGWINLFFEGRRWIRVKATDIRQLFKNATPFFVTYLSGMIKDKTLTIVIGSFIGMTEVAIYDLAMKIVQIPRIIINSINTALFPEIVTNSSSQRVQKVLNYEHWIGIGAILLIVLFGYPAVWILGGEQMLGAYWVAVILSYTIYTYLVVGAYLQFKFVARGYYNIIAYNQIVAMTTCFALCALGMWIHPCAWVVALSLSLSGGLEIIYCRYKAKSLQL
ncbi:MAG: oligosaccharide flippase family protein [Bacteroidaceae bacterium]|nr:oligosaccharide flippase family protein [Bacteroidaceae bacterium]